MKRSIILVYYREPEYLRSAITALMAEFPDRNDTEVIVVDNASGDGMAEEVQRQWPLVQWVPSSTNLYYGGGNNLGVSKASGEWVMILNCDVQWQLGQFQTFVSQAEQQASISAPKLQYEDGRVQISAHHHFPTLWSVFVDYCLPLQLVAMKFGGHPMQKSVHQHEQTGSVAHVTGVCLYLPRVLYLRLGGFDPAYPMYLEETDLQRRLATIGLHPYFITEAVITHFGSAKKHWAQASPLYVRSLRVYAQRWWNPVARIFLFPSILLADLVSMTCLLLAWPISLVTIRIRSRIEHYLTAYLLLLRSIFIV